MKKTSILFVLLIIFIVRVKSQAVYVDEKYGNDTNPGTLELPIKTLNKASEIINDTTNNIYTIKINPGLYILDKAIQVQTNKSLENKRIIIESAILPGDSSWSHEKMPVIISTSKKGDLSPESPFIVGFLIKENNVTIRGLKFLGYSYPNAYYFPIARLKRVLNDLLVEQCMFVGDLEASHIQVAVLAHGNGVLINHCVFNGVKNAVVYWMSAKKADKTGNGMTNSVIYDSPHAIWTAWKDKDFIFKNNIVANCNYFWIRNQNNETIYPVENCVVINYKNYQGVPTENKLKPTTFNMVETNVIKEGKVSINVIENIDHPVAQDYLHVQKNSLGYSIGAGLFKKTNN